MGNVILPYSIVFLLGHEMTGVFGHTAAVCPKAPISSPGSIHLITVRSLPGFAKQERTDPE